MTSETFSAVCGQKCGPVQVASLEATNCPQCGHPLTTPPSAQPDQVPPAGSESYAEMQARVEREGKMREGTLAAETIAGTPVVSTETKQPSAADLDAVAAEQQAADATRGQIIEVPAATDAKPAEVIESVEAQLAGALVLAGYPPEEAAELAKSAIDEIAKRKAAAAGAPATQQ